MNELQSNRPKVSLEDLLQLKRAERPGPDFWNEFDRQLRAKQLAAIVEVRPSWRSWTNISGKLLRFYLPIGATAVFAATLISIRGSRPAADESLPAAAASPVQTVVKEAATPLQSTQLADATVAPAPSTSSEQPEPMAVAVSPELLAETAPVTPVVERDEMPVALPPSARSIAANLATVESLDSEAAPVLAHLEIPDTAASSDSSPDEEAPAAAASVNPRRARLLALTVSLDSHATSNSDAARSRERIARRLTDQALYDSMSRLGLTGESLSIKF